MDFFGTFAGLVNGVKLTTMLIGITLDFVLGIAVAIKMGEFSFSRLADFFHTDVLYYIGGYFCIGILAVVKPDLAYLLTVSWLVIDAALIGHILSKLRQLGLPIPEKVI